MTRRGRASAIGGELTTNAYRQLLESLSNQQPKDLNEHVHIGNQPHVEQMLYTFERYHSGSSGWNWGKWIKCGTKETLTSAKQGTELGWAPSPVSSYGSAGIPSSARYP